MRSPECDTNAGSRMGFVDVQKAKSLLRLQNTIEPLINDYRITGYFTH